MVYETSDPGEVSFDSHLGDACANADDRILLLSFAVLFIGKADRISGGDHGESCAGARQGERAAGGDTADHRALHINIRRGYFTPVRRTDREVGKGSGSDTGRRHPA